MEAWKPLAAGCLLTSALLVAEVAFGSGGRDNLVAAGLAACGPLVFGALAAMDLAARPPRRRRGRSGPSEAGTSG